MVKVGTHRPAIDAVPGLASVAALTRGVGRGADIRQTGELASLADNLPGRVGRIRIEVGTKLHVVAQVELIRRDAGILQWPVDGKGPGLSFEHVETKTLAREAAGRYHGRPGHVGTRGPSVDALRAVPLVSVRPPTRVFPGLAEDDVRAPGQSAFGRAISAKGLDRGRWRSRGLGRHRQR